MSIFNPICPARGIYEHIERLEARRDQLCRVAQAVSTSNWLRRSALLERMEALDEVLVLEGERAREELAAVAPASAEGATCQLVAALRDESSGDPELQSRARRLFAQSASFAGPTAAKAARIPH
jgi:hypothetical protein